MITQVSRNKGKSLLINADDYTVVDIETTGLSIYTAEIIELSAVKVRDNIIVDEFSTLVRPKSELPLNIAMITGITDEMLQDKPAIENVLEGFLKFIGDDILLGHNLYQYDLNILYDISDSLLHKQIQNDIIDTLRYSKHCDIDVPDYKLATLADFYSITNENAHRALSDCITNHLVYQELKKSFDKDFTPFVKRNRNGGWFSHKNLSSESKAVNELQSALRYITKSGKLENEHIYTIKDWLDKHDEYISNYPFAEIKEAIEKVLKDGYIDNDEIDYLFSLFNELLDPVSSHSVKEACEIDMQGKKVCVTGSFAHGDRSEIEELFKSMGAVIVKTVYGTTDYLIVGEFGSDSWRYGNYGSKIKKALEYQKKGKQVEILGEKEFFEKTGAKND